MSGFLLSITFAALAVFVTTTVVLAYGYREVRRENLVLKDKIDTLKSGSSGEPSNG